MKLQIYSSKYKPYWEETKEIPLSVNLENGESVCVRVENSCHEVGVQDRPFGAWDNHYCCEDCEK